MELSVQNLYGLLIRSRLLSLPEAQAMFQRWQGEATESSAHPGKFAKWMVANGYLTEYQAALLGRGHGEGFFLGDYKILDRLGKGRMAGVYKAVHSLGQMVAIKVLPPSKAKDPLLLGRFQRESRLALGLQHPNIVRAFQIGENHGLHYLVMERLEGETLEEVLERRKTLSPEEAVHIVYQALKGLQCVHEQGLVHRDLKPANLMLLRSPGKPSADTTHGATVKILDIGLARTEYDETAPINVDEPQLTTEGILLGTPDYMAPEQARDPRTVDIRADIYSLGCVLYHTLAGQSPFPDTNIISQMIRHASEPARTLKEFNPAVPDGLQQIVNWMMAKDVNQRYPTPDRAAQALEVFLFAGAEPLVNPETDAKLQTYVQWLEDSDTKVVSLAGEEKSKGTSQTPEAKRPGQRPGKNTPIRDQPIVPPASVPPRNKRRGKTDQVGTKVSATAAVGVDAGKSSGAQASPGRENDAPSPVNPSKRNHPPGGPLQAPMPESASAPGPFAKSPETVAKASVFADEFDVELVTPPQRAERPASTGWTGYRVVRRDFVMFGIGAATVALALVLGKILSVILPQRRRDAPPSDEDDKENDLTR